MGVAGAEGKKERRRSELRRVDKEEKSEGRIKLTRSSRFVLSPHRRVSGSYRTLQSQPRSEGTPRPKRSKSGVSRVSSSLSLSLPSTSPLKLKLTFPLPHLTLYTSPSLDAPPSTAKHFPSFSVSQIRTVPSPLADAANEPDSVESTSQIREV